MIVFDDNLVAEFINSGILDIIKKVLMFCNKQIKKEAIWLLSNIAANSEQDAESLIDSNIIFNIIHSCRDNLYELRKEAIWAMSNIC